VALLHVDPVCYIIIRDVFVQSCVPPLSGLSVRLRALIVSVCVDVCAAFEWFSVRLLALIILVCANVCTAFEQVEGLEKAIRGG
jgi:uncharacterized membrane protein